MKQRTAIILLVIAVLVFLYLKPLENFKEDDKSTWPYTFNEDWNGGHARDRYEIMKDWILQDEEEGPTY